MRITLCRWLRYSFRYMLEHIQADICWVRSNVLMRGNKIDCLFCVLMMHMAPIMLNADKLGITPED